MINNRYFIYKILNNFIEGRPFCKNFCSIFKVFKMQNAIFFFSKMHFFNICKNFFCTLHLKFSKKIESLNFQFNSLKSSNLKEKFEIFKENWVVEQSSTPCKRPYRNSQCELRIWIFNSILHFYYKFTKNLLINFRIKGFTIILL